MKLKSLAIGLGFAVLSCVSMFAQASYNFTTINYPGDTPTVYGPYTVTSATEFINTRIRNRLMCCSSLA